MEEVQKEGEILILPTKIELTDEEISKTKNTKSAPTKLGQKKVSPDESETEKQQLKQLLENLHSQISCPRIAEDSERAIAEWNNEQQVVKITRKKGKLQNFGYYKDKELYLDRYETLFLLELNRLELYFNSILVSIEQAYYLLLGAEKSDHFEKYYVYSTLSRTGFVIKPFRNISYCSSKEITEFDCIWEIFLCSINSNHKISSDIRRFHKFDSIKNSMNDIKEKIRNPHSNNLENPEKDISKVIEFNKKIIGKRKYCPDQNNGDRDNYPSTSKKLKLEKQQKLKSLLNDLSFEPEYEKLKNIFKLEEIEIDSMDKNLENVRNVEITFELYHPKYYSKSKPPIFRAIIVHSSEKFPNNAEINKTYNSQLHKVPLILISIGESKQLQSFIYYFT